MCEGGLSKMQVGKKGDYVMRGFTIHEQLTCHLWSLPWAWSRSCSSIASWWSQGEEPHLMIMSGQSQFNDPLLKIPFPVCNRANSSMGEMDWYPHEINPYVQNWEIWCHFLWGHFNLSGKQTESIDFKFSTTHPRTSTWCHRVSSYHTFTHIYFPSLNYLYLHAVMNQLILFSTKHDNRNMKIWKQITRNNGETKKLNKNIMEILHLISFSTNCVSEKNVIICYGNLIIKKWQ